jgi:hypothetical protein
MSARWMEPFRRALIKGDPNPWCDRLRERIEEWGNVDAEWVKLLSHSVELPNGLIDNADACEAVSRAAKGQKLWPLMALGKRPAKALVGAILLDGATLGDENIEGWRHVGAVIANTVRQRQVRARWHAFAKEIGAPTGTNAKAAVDLAATLVRICDNAREKSALLASLTSDAFTIETLGNNPNLCVAVAKQMHAFATSLRLAAVEKKRERLLNLFQGADRTSALVRQLIGEVLGKPSVTSDKIASVWGGVLNRLAQLKTLARDFSTIKDVTPAIAAAGAPEWAKMLSEEKAAPDDPRTSHGITRRRMHTLCASMSVRG